MIFLTRSLFSLCGIGDFLNSFVHLCAIVCCYLLFVVISFCWTMKIIVYKCEREESTNSMSAREEHSNSLTVGFGFGVRIRGRPYEVIYVFILLNKYMTVLKDVRYS